MLRRIFGVAVKKKLCPANSCAGLEFPVIRDAFHSRQAAWRRRCGDERVTQLLCQADHKVFKKYSLMMLQMKREILAKLNRHANETAPGRGLIRSFHSCRVLIRLRALKCNRELADVTEKNGGADETRTRDLLRDSWFQAETTAVHGST